MKSDSEKMTCYKANKKQLDKSELVSSPNRARE